MIKILTVMAVLLLLVPLLPLYPQFAAEMERALDLPQVTYSQAARFVLAASQTLPENTSVAQAFVYARDQKIMPGNVADVPITLGALSLLMMKSFNIKGGFMYALFPSKRYAYRAMVRRELIQGFADPGLTVSGERFFYILSRVLSYVGDE